MDYRDAVRSQALLLAVIAFSVVWLTGAVDMLRSVFTLCVLSVWAYANHRLAHSQPFEQMPFFRLHNVLHHGGPAYDLVEFHMFEVLMNFAYFGGAAFLLSRHVRAVLDWRVVLTFSVSYVLGHTVVYHMMEARWRRPHEAHHRDTTTNYGPSIMDDIFGTSTVVEDTRAVAGTFVVATLVTKAVELLLSRWPDPWLTQRRL
jgi:hypothetical protein